MQSWDISRAMRLTWADYWRLAGEVFRVPAFFPDRLVHAIVLYCRSKKAMK